MSSPFKCLFHTRYYLQVLTGFYSKSQSSGLIMTSVLLNNQHQQAWYTKWIASSSNIHEIYKKLPRLGRKVKQISQNIFLGFECFSNPTSPPKSNIGSVPCVICYTLSSPTFKGVTCRIECLFWGFLKEVLFYFFTKIIFGNFLYFWTPIF